ncbi:MAG: M4 family metallopeptidase [Flavobacteriaceae bacterium]
MPNHAYALLVDGGTYNGQTIINRSTKAAHIFWRAQSVYLTSTSDFGSLANALEAACTSI